MDIEEVERTTSLAGGYEETSQRDVDVVFAFDKSSWGL